MRTGPVPTDAMTTPAGARRWDFPFVTKLAKEVRPIPAVTAGRAGDSGIPESHDFLRAVQEVGEITTIWKLINPGRSWSPQLDDKRPNRGSGALPISARIVG